MLLLYNGICPEMNSAGHICVHVHTLTNASKDSYWFAWLPVVYAVHVGQQNETGS